MNDTADIDSTNRTMILTEIASGTTCKLIGVIKLRQGYFHGRRKHRRKSGFLRKFREKWDVHKEKDQLDSEDSDSSQRMRGHHQGSMHMGGMRILRRLLDLGITKGCTFLVVQGSSSGPILVQVRGTRVALGQGLAGKMLVEVIDVQ
ncbi:MAG: ferrous iron transport protein A [Candidatus Thorarchaeota archaeon]